MMQPTKTNGGTFDNDAKACFDRIIPALTNLCSRQLNVPLVVVFGPTSHGGIGLQHLYVEQGYQKTSALLLHNRLYSRLDEVMWAAIQWTQVTAGVDFALLAEP
jgi:hypothetical protein